MIFVRYPRIAAVVNVMPEVFCRLFLLAFALEWTVVDARNDESEYRTTQIIVKHRSDRGCGLTDDTYAGSAYGSPQ